MKNLILIAATSICCLIANAESSIECTISGGAESVLSIAPKYFQVSEAGAVSLYVGSSNDKSEEKVSIEVNSDSGEGLYYGSDDITFGVAESKKVLTEGSSLVRGQEKYVVKGCANEESTTATYSFNYKKGNQEKSAGIATYSCQCALD